MRKPVMAGNWKMNQSLHRVSSYFIQLSQHLNMPWENILEKVDVIFAVPFTLLQKTSESLAASGVRVAAQNVHWKDKGAFTGEISVPMLREIGVQASLVAHSERRQHFGETDESAAEKVKACLAGGLSPILCIGETLQQREEGNTFRVLKHQLQTALSGLDQTDSLIVAYEPVWAIGTGVAASPDQAEEAHTFIRKTLGEILGRSQAEHLRVLYGGSMNPGNTKELLSRSNIDGGLIGGASLKPAEFGDMILSALK